MTGYLLILMVFSGYGYQGYPVFPEPGKFAFESEQECREAGLKTGYAEMPPPSTPPRDWPNKGWVCKVKT